MGMPFIVQYNEIPSQDCIRCRICGTRVAFVQDYVSDVNDLFYGGVFYRLVNVEVTEDERYHQVIDDNTLAHIHCLQCRMQIGWKLIAVPRPTRNFREGRFCMRLDKLIYWNDVTLLHSLFGTGGANEQAPDDQDGGADEQDHDQDVGANEQSPNDQEGGANEQGPNDQDGGTNVQNADQGGVANEQIPNEQDLGANEQNADQDGDAYEQVPNEQDVVVNEQNADQHGVGIEQVPEEQDVVANEQNADLE